MNSCKFIYSDYVYEFNIRNITNYLHSAHDIQCKLQHIFKSKIYLCKYTHAHTGMYTYMCVVSLTVLNKWQLIC